MTAVLKFLKCADTLAAVMGILFNLLLLYFIRSIKQYQMQAFSKALLQNCILDLILSLSTIVAETQICLKDHIYYLVIGNTLYTPNYTATSIIICGWSGFLFLSLYALPVPFFVRYQIICRKQATTRLHFLVAYGIVFLAFFGELAITLWCYPPVEEHYYEMEFGLNNTFWVEEYGRIPSFVGAHLGSPLMLATYCYLGGSSAISYIIVLYFSIKIARELKKSELTMFSNTKVLHKQFHRAMIIQAASPFFAGTLPISCLTLMSFFKYESFYFSLVCSGFTAWVPVVNPIAAIFIIGPYRKTLLKIVPLFGMFGDKPQDNATTGLQLSMPSSNQGSNESQSTLVSVVAATPAQVELQQQVERML